MNCTNCGAPMILLDHRDYYFCRYCGSFYFPRADVDGIRVLKTPDGNVKCPICGVAITGASLDGHRGLYCPNCRGILLAQYAFRDLITLRRARAQGPAETPQPLSRKDLARKILCPRCREQMNVHPYYGPGNIIIDTCSRCHLIWLDHGELRTVVDAPGRDRGRAPTPTAR